MEALCDLIAGRIAEQAVGAALLALAVAALGRLIRQPSVLHVLWAVVLCKLLTPPLVELSVLPPQPFRAAAPLPAEALGGDGAAAVAMPLAPRGTGVAHLHPGDRRAYAEGLLKTLELVAAEAAPIPATATGMASRSDLRERLTMILTPGTPHLLSSRQRGLLAAAGIGLLLVLPSRAELLSFEHRRQELLDQLRTLEAERERFVYERQASRRQAEIQRLDSAAGEAGAAEEGRRALEELEHSLHRQRLALWRQASELERQVRIDSLRARAEELSARAAELPEEQARLAEEVERIRRQLAALESR